MIWVVGLSSPHLSCVIPSVVFYLQFAPHLSRSSQVRSLHLDKPDGWGIYALRSVNRQIGEGADAIVEKEEG
jgi:hypothetical protein